MVLRAGTLSTGLRFAVIVIAAALLLMILERRWHVLSRFVAEQARPLDLAVARVVVMAAMLWSTRLEQIAPFTSLDRALIVPLRGWSHFIWLVPLDDASVVVAYGIFVVAAILGMVGWHGRAACAIAGACFLYLQTIPQLFGKVDHTLNHLVLFSAILAVAPSCDAVAFDARRAASRSGRTYALALQTMMLTIALAYFFPGAWKLARSGSHWFTAENLRVLIQSKLLETQVTSLQAQVLASPVLLRFLAAGTIVFELGFLFAILVPLTRWVAVVVGLAFHASTALLMDIRFPALQAAYVVFIPWAACRDWVALGWRARAGPAVAAAAAGPIRSLAEDSARAPLRFVCATLLTGMIVTGALHIVNTWPIACYPTFDVPAQPEIDRLVVLAQDSASQAREWTLSFDSAMGAQLGAERWRGLIDTFTNPGARFDEVRARALLATWSQMHRVGPFAAATFVVETYPVAGLTAPPRRRVLGTIAWSAPIVVAR